MSFLVGKGMPGGGRIDGAFGAVDRLWNCGRLWMAVGLWKTLSWTSDGESAGSEEVRLLVSTLVLVLKVLVGRDSRRVELGHGLRDSVAYRTLSISESVAQGVQCHP